MSFYDIHIDITVWCVIMNPLQMPRKIQVTTLNAPTTVAPTWFTRDGSAVPSDKVSGVDLVKGKAFYSFIPMCGRCGGQGGSQAWSHTGYVCYECNGTRVGPRRTLEVFLESRLAVLNASRDKRRAKAQAKLEKAEADRLDELRGPWQAWKNDNADLIAEMRKIADSNKFIGDLLAKLDAINILSERQITAAQKCVDDAHIKAQERISNEQSKWIGKVGDRAEFTFTVERIIDWTKPDDYPLIYRYLHICKDASGNAIKYVGNAACMPGEGETVTLKATVAAHETYDGIKQTVLSRPAIIKK
jgi:hypothetical protein